MLKLPGYLTGCDMEKSLFDLLSVARLFLQKRATIGQLRQAVREAEKNERGRETMLKDLLAKLQAGEEVALSYITNQRGREIENEILAFRNGEWLLNRINCYSSRSLGLGTCRCNSHNPIEENIISEKEAMKLLKEYENEKVENV